MGVACSPDIFQAKIFELLRDIEVIKTYIDDILAVHKDTSDKHLKHLEEVFKRCRKANLN